MELAEVADELYALTPEEFTKTRNERVKEAKAESKDLSNAIKALTKPSTAAWAVNMLARNQPDVVSQVVELGEALRDAQENLEGDELRQLTRQRRQLTAAVTTQVRRLASDLGVRITESVATQVEETLRAAMTDAGAAKAVRSGQLLEALSATGLGDLDVSSAVAVPEAIGMTARRVERKKTKLTVVEEPASAEDAAEAEGTEVPGGSEGSEDAAANAAEDAAAAEKAAEKRAAEETRQASARAAEEAEAVAAKAQKKLDKARKRTSKLEARSLQLQGQLEELRRKAGELEHELETVDDELSSSEEKRERAEKKQAETRAAADEAQARVE
ncbi:MAG TPA: hypothetical protein VFG63_00630 [Nocardioidaceae bacterium]|nr:hypothetical protein [Nocardioidaceae bacterium]